MSEPEKMTQPPGIRRECLEDETLCRRVGDAVSAYDPESMVGGVLDLVTNEWLLFYPIDAPTFAGRAARATAVIHAMQASPKKAERLI